MTRAASAPVTDAASATAPDVSPEAIAALIAQGAALLQANVLDEAPHPPIDEAQALELLIGVTHDMCSPLSSMMVLVERLRSGQAGPVTPTQERQLGLLYSAVFGLATLTNDALDSARGTQQLTGIEPVAFLIADVFAAVRDLVQPVAEERGLAMRWSTAIREKRVGHPAAMHRVLLNLVTNALKNTSRGSVNVSALLLDDTRIEFGVVDSGNGIPEHILSRYSGADCTDSMIQFSSSGLGLGLCARLVREMGGSLDIENLSAGGASCRFSLLLPPVN